jgi:hypothetical protein
MCDRRRAVERGFEEEHSVSLGREVWKEKSVTVGTSRRRRTGFGSADDKVL